MADYACVEACPYHSAYKYGHKVAFHFNRCLSCDNKPCVVLCNSGALMVCGKSYTSGEVLDIVMKDFDFYRNSGGGVTFTGGEPLAQPAFLKEMLQECKKKKIHTAIETCGYASASDVKSILPFTDLFLYDIKIADSKLHKKYTGKPNVLILENLAFIASSGKQVIVRLPLVPGITDTNDNLQQVAEIMAGLGIKEINIEPYNPLGEEKYLEYGCTAKLQFKYIYTNKKLNDIASYFKGKGITCLPA